VFEEYLGTFPRRQHFAEKFFGFWKFFWGGLKFFISPPNHRQHTIVDLAQTFQYEQLIKESTRITKTSSTLIDLAFSNKPELIIDSGVEHIGISDHSMIYVCRKVSIPQKSQKLSTQDSTNISKLILLDQI
jgi:hypothetical protein